MNLLKMLENDEQKSAKVEFQKCKAFADYEKKIPAVNDRLFEMFNLKKSALCLKTF
jgi:hypothetical protein